MSVLQFIDKNRKEELLREVMHALGDIDFTLSPPEMSSKMFGIIEKYTGGADLYADVKKKSNNYILALEDELRKLIVDSKNPFESALKLAVAGNLIDFGAKHDFSDEMIHSEIEKALSSEFLKEDVIFLEDEIKKARKILYLGDNTGEIVFDKLFIERLPKEKIIFAVRGKPAINDVLMEDAEMVGLTKLVPVVSNGSGIPGTVLKECSEEFRRVFDEADLIISKGQGNYETLSQLDKKIFFLLRIKCHIVALDLKRKVGDFVFNMLNEKQKDKK
jgi:uncharacterized protein with ATP-grasp and redox domains